jgi:hypothetical protein
MYFSAGELHRIELGRAKLAKVSGVTPFAGESTLRPHSEARVVRVGSEGRPAIA